MQFAPKGLPKVTASVTLLIKVSIVFHLGRTVLGYLCRYVISGQSYKQFKLVIYESRVVILGIFKSGTNLES